MAYKEFRISREASNSESLSHIDLAESASRIIREFPTSYLIEICIRKGPGTTKIQFPTLSASKRYQDALVSATMRVPIDQEFVTFTLFESGRVKFKNFWSHPYFERFLAGLRTVVYER